MELTKNYIQNIRSNTGICINADVNAAYQIIKLGGIQEIRIKQREQITKLKVA